MSAAAFAVYRAAEKKRESLVAERSTLESYLDGGYSTWLVVERLNRIEAELDDIDDFLERSQQELAS